MRPASVACVTRGSRLQLCDWLTRCDGVRRIPRRRPRGTAPSVRRVDGLIRQGWPSIRSGPCPTVHASLPYCSPTRQLHPPAPLALGSTQVRNPRRDPAAAARIAGKLPAARADNGRGGSRRSMSPPHGGPCPGARLKAVGHRVPDRSDCSRRIRPCPRQLGGGRRAGIGTSGGGGLLSPADRLRRCTPPGHHQRHHQCRPALYLFTARESEVLVIRSRSSGPRVPRNAG